MWGEIIQVNGKYGHSYTSLPILCQVFMQPFPQNPTRNGDLEDKGHKCWHFRMGRANIEHFGELLWVLLSFWVIRLLMCPTLSSVVEIGQWATPHFINLQGFMLSFQLYLERHFHTHYTEESTKAQRDLCLDLKENKKMLVLGLFS